MGSKQCVGIGTTDFQFCVELCWAHVTEAIWKHVLWFVLLANQLASIGRPFPTFQGVAAIGIAAGVC